MATNRRLSRTQKRANKKRDERRKKFGGLVKPYEGRKYQGESYVNVVMRAETGIREADEISGRRLTGRQVKKCLEYLVLELQGRKPEVLPSGVPTTEAQDGHHEDIVTSRIKANWDELFTTEVRPANSDLTGVLRTLMFSVQARDSYYGHDRGYLDFIIEFLGQMGVGAEVLSAGEWNDEELDDEFDEEVIEVDARTQLLLPPEQP